MCKKRFKNETSKNYHEMFHTQEERDEANGGPVSKPKSRADDFSDSDSDSELFENRKTKKGAGKAKEEVKVEKKKTPCEDPSLLPTEPPPTATKEAPLLPVEEVVLPKIGEKYRPHVDGLD